MYIYPTNLNSLRNFISGYNCSEYNHGCESILNRMSPSFNEWLEENHQESKYSTKNDWIEIIQNNSKSEAVRS